MAGIFGALGDPQFWEDTGNNAQKGLDRLRSYGELPSLASDIADREFPDSARDSSSKNAFRHALGTGMVAQELGGGAIGAGVAKLIGYGWEGAGMLSAENRNNPAFRQDSLHDLNANAIGAYQAQRTGNRDELVQALRRLTQNSVLEKPPSAFSSSPGYLTRSVK